MSALRNADLFLAVTLILAFQGYTILTAPQSLVDRAITQAMEASHAHDPR